MSKQTLRNTCQGTVYILASGPSIDFVDLERIKCKPVIAVNYEIFDLWKGEIQGVRQWVNYLHLRDPHFYYENLTLLQSFQGKILYGVREGVDIIHGWNVCRVPMKQGRGVCAGHKIHGNSYSGGSAVNLAYWLGFRKAILIGFDEDNFDGRWYHKDHPCNYQRQFARPIQKRQSFRYAKIAADAKALGFTILNCSPKSRIKSFPKINQEAL